MAKKQNFIHGAAILTVGVIIMKLLGFIYKIPLGNILGDEGYSMFTSAYSIYFIFFTLATAGLPVALSRLIAEADANGRAKQEEKTFRVALATFAVIGVIFALILFLFPEWLAAKYLENPDAALSIKAMAPSILLVCLVSAYRGYCQGNGNMIPTTVDEVLEVLFKVISGLILASCLLKAGFGKPVGSAGAILGVSIGSVISLLYMIIYKRRHYSELSAPYTAGIHDPNDTPDDDEVVDSAWKIVKDILSIGIPIAFGACIMAILNSVDSKLCMNRLQSAAGFSYYQAKVLYGVYGKAQTLFNLPAAFITPLTIAIVPEISGAIAKGANAAARRTSADAMRISAVISLPMGVGLTVLAYPIMNVLYPNSNAAGPGLLAIMGAASFFVCTVLMENAILQASGHEKLHHGHNDKRRACEDHRQLVPLSRSAPSTYTARRSGTLVSYVVMAPMNYIFICVALKHRPKLFGIFAHPLAASVLMGAAAWAIYGLCSRFIGAVSWSRIALCMLVAIAVAVIVYLVSTDRAPLHHQRGHETHPRRGKNREFLAHPLIFM